MISRLLSSALLLCSVRCVNGQLSRIVDGNDVKNQEKYPYFAHFGDCGGAVIAPEIVLSAAHCSNYKNEQVLISAYKETWTEGAQVRRCTKWTTDPTFFDLGEIKNGKQTLKNDFGLCLLDKPVFLDEPENIARVNEDPILAPAGADVIAMGLGSTIFRKKGNYPQDFPEILQEVTLSIVSNENCEPNYIAAGETIDDSMICAENDGKDTCNGDSGGPLIYPVEESGQTYPLVVGVVSWGIGCGKEGYPGVYSRVSSGFEWIHKVVCEDWKSPYASFCTVDNGPPPPPPPPPKRTCGGGKTNLTIHFTTGKSAQKASFQLKDETQGKVVLKEKQGRFRVGDYKNEYAICLNNKSEYSFTAFTGALNAIESYALKLGRKIIAKETDVVDQTTSYFMGSWKNNKCYDDPTFQYGINYGCSWLSNQKRKCRTKVFSGKRIRSFCPSICKKTCRKQQ